MADQLPPFHVCIIGSGPAGAFAANVLARNGYSVAVVEAGGSLVDSDPGNVIDEQRSNIVGGVKFGFSQQIGGSSNLWAGFIARFNPIDFVERPQFNAPGWLINLADLEPYYARVDDYFRIRRRQDEGDEKLRPVTAQSAINAHETILLEPPFETSTLVRKQARIHLLDNSPARRLIWETGSTSIREVELLEMKSGRFRRLRARTFIVAAGTLTNIRLLLHSLAERKGTMPKNYDLIGRGFSTHPKAYVGAIKLNRQLQWDHPFISLERLATHSRIYQFGLDERVLLDKGLLNHCLRFEPPFRNRLHRAFERAKNLLAHAPLVGGGKGVLADQVARLGRQAYIALDKITPRGAPPDWLAARLFLDQAVRPENRVTLSSRHSPSGLPLAVLDWRFTEDDWWSAESFLKAFDVEVRRLGIGSFTFKRPVQHKFTAIHSHFLGGTPMGSDPNFAVLNANLRVHGVDNLYVSGPSVFPSYGYANPFYTVAALSIRLGDHLTMVLDKQKSAA